MLHYVVIVFLLPPIIFINPNTILSNPSDLHDFSQYIAYYVHIVATMSSCVWIGYLLKVTHSRQDKSSEEESAEGDDGQDESPEEARARRRRETRET